MGVYAGTDISDSGLVFEIDVASKRCISPLGCTGFNNAPQLVKNLVSPSSTINSYGDVKLGNLNYYTVFAIDYPEGSYGGDAAGRNGITPGYNVRSGAFTFNFGRALQYAVYNNPTQSWVKTTVYDSYVGTAAVDTFVSEYATAVATYPDAVHIVAGSHRDSNHTAAQYAILRDLGAPSNVDTIINFSSPEWILVGKPGLGAGNAYGWAFQNYSTNPDQVAHLNFGLPIYGGTSNYLEFNGSTGYITHGASLGSFASFTVIIWFYPTSISSHQNPIDCNYSYNGSTGNIGPRLEMNSSGNLTWIYSNITGDNSQYYAHSVLASRLTPNTWHCAAITYSPNSSTTYYNGNPSGLSRTTIGSPTGFVGTMSNVTLGKGFHLGGAERIFAGRISHAQIYNRALTATEIKQNYDATKARFGLDYDIVKTGLVLHLDAGNIVSYPGSGTTWNDISGVGNHGSMKLGVGYNSSNQGYLTFNGSDQYVNIGAGKGVNQFSGDFTISAWAFRTSGSGTWGNIIGDYYTNSVGTTNEWQLLMSSTANFVFYRVGTGYVISPVASGYTANQWVNVVVSRIGSTVTMYANGTSIATATNSETFGTSTGNFNIGIDGNNSAEPFAGGIANILIYKNKGLTAAEVQQNFNISRARFGV